MAVDRLGRPLRDDPFRGNARVVATSNITLSGLQTIDGVTLDSNDRVLAVGQTTASQNGLYVAKNGAWSRTRDLSTADDFNGPIYVAVEEGTVGRNKTYSFLPSGAVTVGSTSISFTENTLFQLIDGDKGDITVSSSGTVWNIDAGAVGAPELATDAVETAKIADTAVTFPKLSADVQPRIPLRFAAPTFGTPVQSLLSSALTAAASRTLELPDAQMAMTGGVTSENPVDLRGFGTGAGPGPAAQSNSLVTQFMSVDDHWDFEITSNFPSYFEGMQFNHWPANRPQAAGGGIRITADTGNAANTVIDRIGFTNKRVGVEFHKPSSPQVRGVYADSWIDAAVKYTTDASNEGAGGLLLHPYLFGTSGSTTQGAGVVSEVGYLTVLGGIMFGAAYSVDFSVKNYPAGRMGIFNAVMENPGVAAIRARTQDSQPASMFMVHGNEFSNVEFTDDHVADVLIEAGSGEWLDTVSISGNVHRHVASRGDFDAYRILSGTGVRVDNALITFLDGTDADASAFNIGAQAENVFLNQPMIVGTIDQPYRTITAETSIFDTINGLTVAQLPGTVRNGSVAFVLDAVAGGTTLAGSGTGALAVRANGAWSPLHHGDRIVRSSATLGTARLLLQNPDASGVGFDLVWTQTTPVFIDRATFNGAWVRQLLTPAGGVLYSMDQSGNFTLRPTSSVTPANNGDLVMQATSNTSLTFKFKGSDGTVRSGSITLA